MFQETKYRPSVVNTSSTHLEKSVLKCLFPKYVTDQAAVENMFQETKYRPSVVNTPSKGC